MILVLNLGLKSIRAIVFDDSGRRISIAARKVNSRLIGDWVEQDAADWRRLMHEVVREAIDLPKLKGAIEYITVSCSASCLVSVDANLQPTYRVIMVSDRRANAEGQRISKDPEFQELAKRLGYSSSQYSQMARMLWIKENEPEAYGRTSKFLAPNDFLIALLSGGETVTDILNAEKAYWDAESYCYPDSLYSRFGLNSKMLPRCVEIGTEIGLVCADLAADLGLESRPRIIVGTYDAICSVFGTGAALPGQVCDVSGTVTSVRMYSDKPFVDVKGRVMSQYFPPSNGYLIGGSNNLGGGLIENGRRAVSIGTIQTPMS